MKIDRPARLGVLTRTGCRGLRAPRHRARGQRIVFTNGVFDLLHPGTCDICSRRARSATC